MLSMASASPSLSTSSGLFLARPGSFDSSSDSASDGLSVDYLFPSETAGASENSGAHD